MRRIAAALCVAASPALAFDLAFPVDCTLGESCYIQNYVDRDPGPGWSDFGCGHLSYDGHKGTDVALRSLAAMAAGVDVLAVAPGTVRATRDGMMDISANAANAPDVSERACGNAVVVAHEGGWQSQYCHLRRGSVAVRSGDAVEPGTVLGQVGLSGRTEFPHLHLTMRRDGETIDPFQPNGETACGDSAHALWADGTDYETAGFISAGFFDAVPAYGAVQAGSAEMRELPADAQALVAWGFYFGPREGDVLAVAITGPGGMFLEQELTIDRTQARAFRAVGRKLNASTRQPGTYNATLRLLRDGQLLDTISARTQVMAR
ncbi:Peptidase, M23/M37 family [Candidatus Rhodobacter oscarellae]|uniref:Peptidase, M23/M37 family n=1 Tax=Candidatus Rhodobacter oscarellae TaxID=1675527 RepID=A0A0J9GRH1_9RHOB|nr:M23 family metallopeptidase [Candidatus Rhodobacter lobularis]KMW56088.1 Peptidase, M23/M37 family [Candidatus Rhodobacter lobularis]